MSKCSKVCALFFVTIGIFSLCNAAGIEDLFKDPNVVRKHYYCVMDQGPCDAIGATAKNLLLQVVKDNCARCTRQQITTFNKIVEIMETRYPAEWSMILLKYTGSSMRRRL